VTSITLSSGGRAGLLAWFDVISRIVRLGAFAVAVTVVVSACSAGDDDVSTSIVPPSPPVTSASAPSTTEPAATPTTEPVVPDVVTVAVSSPELDVDAELSVDAESGGDPFGTFATCSAYRSVVGAYIVGVSDPTSEVSLVSVVSASRIDGPGTYDADLRVETSSGPDVSAAGTITVDPGLASGSYVAFSPDGARIEGTFDCEGGDEEPATMAASDAGAIEVVVLLERSGSERVVSAATLGADPTDCPAGEGSQSLVVRLDGDDTLGAITTFELDEGTEGASMRLRVGEATYEFDDVAITLDDNARAGTFGAALPDLTVGGAFACT
jgi:hypothetical protein